jgi:outer membrane protein OmpA-like peptidoglycan-associated protein
MFCRKRLGGFAVASVTLLHVMPVAWAQERMQLGAPLGAAAEFQAQVGDRVFFSEGSAELGARARAALEAQATWLKRHTALPVTVEGHADDAGALSHNLEVSLRRAEAVRRRLIEGGVVPARIRTVAYGRERLIAECSEPNCTAQNRRAVTVVGAPTAASAPAGAAAREPQDTAARRSPRRLY